MASLQTNSFRSVVVMFLLKASIAAHTARSPFLVEYPQDSRGVSLGFQDYPDDHVVETDTGRVYQWLIRGPVLSSLSMDWQFGGFGEANLTFFDGPTDEFNMTKTMLKDGNIDSMLSEVNTISSVNDVRMKYGLFHSAGFYALIRLETIGNFSGVLYNMTIRTRNLTVNPVSRGFYAVSATPTSVNATSESETLPDRGPQTIFGEITFEVKQAYYKMLPTSIELKFKSFLVKTSGIVDCSMAGFVIIDQDSLIGPFCGSSEEDRFSILRTIGYVSTGSELRIFFYQYIPPGHESSNTFYLSARTADCQGVLWEAGATSIHPSYVGKPICLQSLSFPSATSTAKVMIKPVWFGQLIIELDEQPTATNKCKALLQLRTKKSALMLKEVTAYKLSSESLWLERTWNDCDQHEFVHFYLKLTRKDECQMVSCDLDTHLQQSMCGKFADSSMGPGRPPGPPTGGNKPPNEQSEDSSICTLSVYMHDDAFSENVQCNSGEYHWYYELTIFQLQYINTGPGQSNQPCTIIEENVSPTGCTSSLSSGKVYKRTHARFCDADDDVLPTDRPRVYKTIGPQFKIINDKGKTFHFSYKLVKSRRNVLASPDSGCACPEGLYIQYKCHCYSFGLDQLTWVGATFSCIISTNRHALTSIVDGDEMNAIWEMIWGEWWPAIVEKGVDLEWIFIDLSSLIFKGLEGTNKWSIQEDPLVFSEWYSGKNQQVIRSEPSFLLRDRDQPSPFDKSTDCGAMYFSNVYEYGNWFKIPCAVPLKTSAYICKGEAIRDYPLVGGLTPNRTLSLSGHLVCRDGWNYVQGVCLRLLGNFSIGYDEAELMCYRESGSMAMANETMSHWFNVYMNIWMHRPEYGLVWLRQQDDKLYFLNDTDNTGVWRIQVEDLSLNMSVVNVLCEMEPESSVVKCGENQFECADGSYCIVIDRRCDFVVECPDESDEVMCNLTSHDTTPTNVWHIGNNWYHQCYQNSSGSGSSYIPISRYCDYFVGCSNIDCKPPICQMSEFQCKDGQCIQQSKRCDLINDCSDRSDEKDCSGYECRDFVCYAGTCIPNKAVGDIFVDCPGLAMEDEQFVVDSVVSESKGDDGSSSDAVQEYPICSQSDHTRCRSSHPYCFPRSEACIYDHDHYNYTTGCRDMSHLRLCKDYQCPGMFKCSSGYCIRLHKLCDGVSDCKESEDERNCPSTWCPGAFKCGGKDEHYCIDQSKVCDGFNDCQQSGDDERYCHLPECPVGCECVGFVVNCRRGENITSIAPFSSSTRALILSYNRVNIDSYWEFFYLAHLNISFNKISHITPISFLYLGNLLELDLSYNFLTSLESGTFVGLGKLISLLLAGNPMQALQPSAFSGLNSLPTLLLNDCELNELKGLTFEGLTSLKTLSFRNASVTTISVDAFEGLEGLITMDMTQNDIALLTPDVFSDLTSLMLLSTDELRYCCAYYEISSGEDGTCYPAPDQFSSCKDLLKWPALTVSIWILGVLAFIGNLFVIIWRLVKERSNVVNILVLNLGLSDFLMGVYLLIIAVADTVYRDRYAYFESAWRSSGFCTAASILSTLSSEMSVFMLVVITADRVITILFTFKVKRLDLKRIGIIVAICWLASAFIAVLPLFGGDYFDGFTGSNAVCLSYNPTVGRSKGFEFTVFVLTLNLVAFVFIFVGYVAIFHHYLSTRKALAKLSFNSAKSRELALAKKLVFILTTDFICWVPIITLKYVALSGVLFPDWVAPVLAVVILPLNSSLNPFLYTISALLDERKRKMKKKMASTLTNSTGTDHVKNQSHKGGPDVEVTQPTNATATPNGSFRSKRSKPSESPLVQPVRKQNPVYDNTACMY